MADGTKSSTTHTVYIIIIVILLVVIGVGFWHFSKNQQQSAMAAAPHGTMSSTMTPPKYGKGMNMPMLPATPPPVSDQQQQQLTAGTDTSTTTKTFNITGGNYYFVPDKITVNQGDKVTFVMTNAGGFHDLVIDELGVKTQIIKTGEAATATFTASKKGSFLYYCSVKGHRQKGMSGTLTVQ